MPHLDIDPDHLTVEEAKLLFTFFKRNAVFSRYWHQANTLYSPDNQTTFYLAYDVLQCPSEEPEQGMRYYFVGKEALQDGPFGRTYPVVGILRETEAGFVYQRTNTQTPMTCYLAMQQHSEKFPFERALEPTKDRRMQALAHFHPPMLDSLTNTSRMIIEQKSAKNPLHLSTDDGMKTDPGMKRPIEDAGFFAPTAARSSNVPAASPPIPIPPGRDFHASGLW